MSSTQWERLEKNWHDCVHLPSEHPVAKSSEDFEESAKETSQLMALTHELCALRTPMSIGSLVTMQTSMV